MGRSANGIRSSAVAASPVPPRGHTPLSQAFTEKYALQKILVDYNNASTNIDVAGFDVVAGIYTPSTRLNLTIQAFFEPYVLVNVDPSFQAPTPQWSATKMNVNSISGRESTSSTLFALTNLPDQYITDQPCELIRVNIHVRNDQFRQAFAGGGCYLILQAKWEPDVQTVPADELMRLYDRCRIAAGPPIVISNIAIP